MSATPFHYSIVRSLNLPPTTTQLTLLISSPSQSKSQSQSYLVSGSNNIYPQTTTGALTTIRRSTTPKYSRYNATSQIAAQNSPLWTVSEMAEALNGTIVKWGPPGSVSSDTRTLQPGQWFFALSGKNFDAHDFITPELYGKGCVGVIGNRVCANWEKGFVQVEGNTLVSLEKLAIHARNRFHGCLIGLTGSVGKTTTRTMIALALESLGGRVHRSPGNWNNRIGVALSLIGIPRDVEYVVLELGTSGKGEILELTRICSPSIRVILNVGASHLEGFSSLEGVAIEKGEILKEAKPGDVCVLNADDPLVMSLSVPVGLKKVLFGRRMDCDVRLVLAESINGGLGSRVVLETNKEIAEFVISSPGIHMAINACAAAAVANLLGTSLPQIGKSLSRFVPVRMRSELEVAKNGIKIINDVYNANPASTKAAIELIKAIDCRGKRVAILGDMLELGSTEISSHEMMLRHCLDACFDLVALVGKRYLTAATNLNLVAEGNIICALDSGSLALEIVRWLSCYDVVLVKGSRAMQMEKVVETIKALHIGDPH